MRNKILTAAALAAVVLLNAAGARAQAGADESGFEVGAQFTLLRLNSHFLETAGPINCVTFPCEPPLGVSRERVTDPGFGGRVGYNFNRHVAAEAEVNFFPRERGLERGRKVQGLLGVKAGRRFEGFGVFAKARPGVVHDSAGDFEFRPDTVCIAIFPPPVACFDRKELTSFAFDVGGVVEFYPSARTIIRVDVGDTLINYKGRSAAVGLRDPSGQPRGVLLRSPSETTHNFQASVGIGYRF